MLNYIKKVFEQHAGKLAFCIKNQNYSYSDFQSYIAGIRVLLQKENPSSHFIGLAAYDDIETYAAILAIWAEGYAFVPLSLQNPADRNKTILDQVQANTILSSQAASSKLIRGLDINWVSTKGHVDLPKPIDFIDIDADQIMCMLFTSGSTGVPKGVPYTFKNINSTLDAFFSLGYELDEKDCFLQMFELTFDMSMLSYLPAWCIGASVHTLGSEGIKYLQAFKVLKEQAISFAAMVPSTLKLLEPYFSQINLKSLRYCLLGGEPFYTALAEKWLNCVPNAQVVNISGPCEITMACMGYNLDRNFKKNKSHKGVLAFGYPWKNTTVILLNDEGNLVEQGEEGELCFGGDHVMNAYWKMPEKNATIFFERAINGQMIRFYRSGDIAFQDKEGTFYACGRKDIQYKIQGYKVELGDIEQHARAFMNKGNAAAIVLKNEKGLLDIHLFIDQDDVDRKELLVYLKNQLSSYMWPRTIRVLKTFPLTISGKLDRSRLIEIFEGNDFEWINDMEMTGRIVDNLYSSYRVAAKYIGKPILEFGNMAAIDAQSDHWPRILFGTPKETELEKITLAIREGTLPPQLIMPRPLSPEVLYDKISQSGFRQMMTWPGMAINLLDKTFPKIEIDIKILQTGEKILEWCSVVNEVLFVKTPLKGAVIERLLESEQFLFYGLSVDGKLMTVAMGHVLDNGFGIYMVATKEEARRKGYAKALTLYMLEDAKQRGCRAAYLEASAMGTTMYKQIGFKTFCHLDIFWLLGVR